MVVDQERATKCGTVIVTVYPIVGRQLFFRVPKRLCEECDMTIATVRDVVARMGNRPDIEIRIKPWLNHLPDALRRGGWHPPVLTINGRVFSQGIVPDALRLRDSLNRCLDWGHQ